MHKQTICFVEPGDIIYLIDDNFDIKSVELYQKHLDVNLNDRSCISDEVDTISDSLIIGSPYVACDRVDLLEVYLDTDDSGDVIRRRRLTDRKAFTSKEVAETYLMTKIDKNRIARTLLKDVNKEINGHLLEIESILKKFSFDLDKYDIRGDVLLNSNLCKISELCDLLDLDQVELLHLDK